jgi:hypothetical protein
LREDVRSEALTQHRILAYGWSNLEQAVLTQQTRKVDVVEACGQRLGPGQTIGVRGEAQIGNADDHDEAPAAPWARLRGLAWSERAAAGRTDRLGPWHHDGDSTIGTSDSAMPLQTVAIPARIIPSRTNHIPPRMDGSSWERLFDVRRMLLQPRFACNADHPIALLGRQAPALLQKGATSLQKM